MRVVDPPVTLKIITWSDERAWTGGTRSIRQDLIGRLRKALPDVPLLEVKRLGRDILAQRKPMDIEMVNEKWAGSVRHVLEASGAEVEIEIEVAPFKDPAT